MSNDSNNPQHHQRHSSETPLMTWEEPIFAELLETLETAAQMLVDLGPSVAIDSDDRTAIWTPSQQIESEAIPHQEERTELEVMPDEETVTKDEATVDGELHPIPRSIEIDEPDDAQSEMPSTEVGIESALPTAAEDSESQNNAAAVVEWRSLINESTLDDLPPRDVQGGEGAVSHLTEDRRQDSRASAKFLMGSQQDSQPVAKFSDVAPLEVRGGGDMAIHLSRDQTEESQAFATLMGSQQDPQPVLDPITIEQSLQQLKLDGRGNQEASAADISKQAASSLSKSGDIIEKAMQKLIDGPRIYVVAD
jgi:hypothetical protein